MSEPVGFDPDEIDTTAPTRAARLKWVVVVDAELSSGRAVNAAICVAAATSSAVSGLLGPAAVDLDGSKHPGLPWAGCTVLAAPASRLRELRDRAASSEGVFVADMPSDAQATRVYDEYLSAVAHATTIDYYAISIVGAKNRIDRMVSRLPLLT